jgi:hypothetical protein
MKTVLVNGLSVKCIKCHSNRFFGTPVYKRKIERARPRFVSKMCKVSFKSIQLFPALGGIVDL